MLIKIVYGFLDLDTEIILYHLDLEILLELSNTLHQKLGTEKLYFVEPENDLR